MASYQKYTTKDGIRWLYKYYGEINSETGKKKPSTKRGFKTKKEAQLDAAKIETEIAEGTFVSQDKTTTFEQVYNQWYEAYSPNFKPSTKNAVQSKFKRQLLPNFGALKMKDITRSYCQDVINKMATQIKTVGNMKMYANQVFEYAIKMDIRTTNPMKGAIIPKDNKEFIASEQEEARNYWEKSEIRKFLQIVKQDCIPRDHLLFHLLIYTGGRKGEILALRWSDIDFKNKTISLSKTLFHNKGGFISLTSKTAASRRVLSLDDTTINLIKKHLREQKKRQLAALDSKESEMLFTRDDDTTPIRLAYPNDKLKEIVTAHDLHLITVHGLRHTHASLLFEAGASIKEVQERLGHSDIQMTMNIYTHVTKTIKEKTADRFEKFMEL